jgi:hypothetical protein
MAASTDGALPADTLGYRSEGVYVPGVGTVAQQGGSVSTDSGGQPYAPTVVSSPTATNFNVTAVQSAAYPTGATPITAASGNVAAATATATLAATSGKTTYITGFSVTGTGATAALAVSVTVTNVVTGTMTYTYAAAAGVAVANTPLNITFPYPIPANTVNTTIVVSCPTLGSGNTNNTVNAYGFQL